MFSQDPAALSNNGKDSSLGYGAKVGYLGQFTDRFSFGLAYQTEIQMDEISDYAGLFANNGDIGAIANPLIPNIAVAPLGSANGAGFGWRDMDVIKFGIQYEPGGPGSGASVSRPAINRSPPSETLLNILAPDVVEDHITLGFTKQSTNGRAWSLSLMHAPSTSVSGPNPLEVPGTSDDRDQDGPVGPRDRVLLGLLGQGPGTASASKPKATRRISVGRLSGWVDSEAVQ